MPSITNNPSSAMAADGTNKSNTINAMLLRAWRERWDDAQWGTHIKTVSAIRGAKHISAQVKVFK